MSSTLPRPNAPPLPAKMVVSSNLALRAALVVTTTVSRVVSLRATLLTTFACLTPSTTFQVRVVEGLVEDPPYKLALCAHDYVYCFRSLLKARPAKMICSHSIPFHFNFSLKFEVIPITSNF